MFIRKSPIFYAADGGESGAAIAVDAANSPTGETIEVTPRREMPAAEIVQPTSIDDKPIRQKGVKVDKVDVARELGLTEAPSDLVNKEAQRARDEKGKFTTGRVEVKKPEAAKPVVKLGEPEPKKVEPVKPVAVKEAPKEPAKVKIGNEEKTAEEWEKHFKELNEKAAKAAAPEKPADPAPETTPEAIAAEEKKTRDEWFDKTSARYTPKQEDFDKMLAEGDAKAFGQYFARLEESVRNWTANSMRPHLEKLHGFDTQLNPILERDKMIAAYQRESEFLDENPDIKSHPEGIRTLREMDQELRNECEDTEQLLAANPNTPNAKRYTERVKALREQFIPELIKEVKQKLSAITPLPVAAPAAIIPPVAKPRPAPPGGQLGGGNAPKKVSSASAEIAELEARGLM